MNKIEDIDINFDSSFLIALEAQKRGYKIFYYNPEQLINNEGIIQTYGYYIELFENNDQYFKFLSEKILVNLSNFKYVFIRQDPPFDMNYITSTYLLDCLPSSTIVINNPTSIRNFSEKISAFQFKKFMPPTIIAQNTETIKDFLIKYEDIITKPLYGNGGEGVYRYTIQDNKLKDTINDLATLKEPLMVQKFIPEIKEGDRRIILIDGQYAGSVARMPMKNSIKANFHAGGIAKKTDLVRRDKEICSTISDFLIKNQLFFAGIDVIGDYLTEINITSPTGMKQINVLNDTNLEKIFWDKLETKYNLV